MKTIKKPLGIFLAATGILSIFIFSCKKENQEPQLSEQSSSSNSPLLKADPAYTYLDIVTIVKEVETVLPNSHVLSAVYMKVAATSPQTKFPYAINMKGQTFVDNGLGMDKVKGDGVYTATVDDINPQNQLKPGMMFQLYARTSGDVLPLPKPQGLTIAFPELKIKCSFKIVSAGSNCGGEICGGSSALFGTQTLVCICDFTCEIEVSTGSKK